MTKVTLTGNVVTTLVYDGDGLRRKKQTASDITKFIWDDQDVLIETNDAGTTQVNYTQTPDTYGSLVSQRRSGTSKFYFYDALGSTSELTNSSQTQTDSYRYYAFGKGLVSTGSTVNPYQYVGDLGYYGESNLALQYLRARWYNPVTGRFGQPDPIQDGLNWYVYVESNPITWIDPSGLQLDSITAAIRSCVTLEPPLAAYRCLKDLFDTLSECFGTNSKALVRKAIQKAYGKLKAREAIAEEVRGGTHRQFPGEFLDETVDAIFKMKKTAQVTRARKILNDGRFR